MRIICQQLTPTVGEESANHAATIAAVEDAVARGADLIVLPELCTSGYVFHDQAEVEASALTIDAPIIEHWRQALKDTDAMLVAGIPLLESDGISNAAIMLDADGVLAVYRKVHLWDEERRWFRAGSEPPPVVQTRQGRIAMMVCFDLEFPEMVRGVVLQGADVIAAPTNWPAVDVPAGERQPEVHDAMSAARLSRIFIACCDRGGSERGTTFAGASAIIGPDGWIRAASDSTQTTTIQADVAPSEARDKSTGASNDVLGDRRPDVYAAMPAVDLPAGATRPVPGAL
jgi:predicted amidohydrolase